MSRQRKRDAVLRLLRGEDLDTVSRSLGVTAATLSDWRNAFLDGGEASGVVIGTASGVVKRVQPDYPANRDEFELITLKDDDRVIGAAYLTGDDAELVFITSDAQLLRFAASSVRPQGRPAAGTARRQMISLPRSTAVENTWFSR